MPQPTRSDVLVSRPLTTISVAHIQRAPMFHAADVFPLVPVERQADQYFRYLQADFWRSDAQKRGPGSESAGSGFRVDTDTYFADVWALHQDVDDQTRQNVTSPLQLDRDATIFVTGGILLTREREFATRYMTAGIWDTDLQGVSGAPAGGQFQQWNEAGSTPIEDITGEVDRIEEQTGFRPNVLALSPEVKRALQNHPDVLDRIKYTERGIVTESLLASLFDIERVVTLSASHNTADEGAAGVYARIVGKHALLAFANPTPSLQMPSAGYIFSWSGLLGAQAFGMRVKRFRMEEVASDRIEGEMAFDMKAVAPSMATFFEDAVA